MSLENNQLPVQPRLVLRIGFAGNRNLPDDKSAISRLLSEIFETIARRLAEIAPGPTINCEPPVPQIRSYYSNENPELRLVTGLAEGGDYLAAETFLTLEKHPELHPHITPTLAAVIPFDLATYRESREIDFLPNFDHHSKRCTYILALDGIYDKPNPDTQAAKHRRARAYRAQAAVLLRHVDLIVAAADPDGGGQAGGTLETVRAALDFDLPVVFLNTKTNSVNIIEPKDDRASAFAALDETEILWTANLRRWVTMIVADPDADSVSEHGGATATTNGAQPVVKRPLLDEFFKAVGTPPLDKKLKPTLTYRERLWSRFEKRFRTGEAPKSDPPLSPYTKSRARSAALNHHFAGLYRGAFLLNYVLAAGAVMLAALSLVFLGYSPSSFVWLPWVLLGLAITKLVCVSWIYLNTKSANDGDWNDKAVDYRYLAERLRAMLYLPRIGSFCPPVAAPPQYAARVIRQSSVDWLADAIIRSVSPDTVSSPVNVKISAQGHGYSARVLQIEPLALLGQVRDNWIEQQAIYHYRNGRTMDRIHSWAHEWGKYLNLAVIAFVVVDVAFIVTELTHSAPEEAQPVLKFIIPWIAFLAATLPATVASLNGIRFQSECHRLAERSAVMRVILAGRTAFTRASQDTSDKSLLGGRWKDADELAKRIEAARRDASTDPGSWVVEVLRFTETVATTFSRDVSEWSVLYAKEVHEP